MDKKLTLSLNEAVIDAAKIYAKENGESLSRLIERYLFSLTHNNAEDDNDLHPVSSRVRRLTGIIELPKDFDEKESITDYLTKKYK